MSLFSWIAVLLLITIVYSLFVVVPVARKSRSVSLLLLSVALIIYSGSSIAFLTNPENDIVIRWFNFSTLVCVVSFLFAMIRESKPIFVRFPTYLIYLPFLTLLFFPLVAHQKVIVNLLVGTFQIGCVLVSIMMYGINQIKNKDSLEHLIASLIFFIAIMFYWFSPIDINTKVIVSEILIVPGIIILSLGIKRNHQLNSKE